MKTIEALWAVYFDDVAGYRNGGVVVFETLRIFGGDSKFYYTGEYEVSGEEVTARVTSTHYHGDGMTAFGFPTTGSVRLEVRGTRQGDEMIGEVWPVEYPSRRVNVRLRRLADLP